MIWVKIMKKLAFIATIFIILALGVVCFLPQSQVQAGTPTDSYTIERYYSESITQQTTTDNTTFQDAVTLSFTPPVTKDYIVIASALVTNSSTSYYTEAKLVIDGIDYGINQFQPAGVGTDNYITFSDARIMSLNNTSHTIAIKYRTNDALGTAYIKNATITVIEATNYHFQEATTANSTASTTYVTQLTLNFTPQAADYLVIARADLSNVDAGYYCKAQLLYDGATSLGEQSWEERTGLQYMSFAVAKKLAFTAEPHTLAIQFMSEHAGHAAYIKNARISVIKLSDIDGDNLNKYAEVDTEGSTKSITYVDQTTLSFTPSARGDYLILSSASITSASSATIVYGNLDYAGASQGEGKFTPQTLADDYAPSDITRKLNLDKGAARIFKIQYMSSVSNKSAYIKDARIVAIRLDTAESYNDSAHTTVDNTFVAGEIYVHIWAHGLKASDNYSVAYYDASSLFGGLKIATDTGLISTAYGNLSSQYRLTKNPSAVAGIWHAVVFDSDIGSPPTYYDDAAAAAGYVVEDDFDVTAQAIPEFSTVFAAIAVAGLCFGIYYWMRRRYQRQAVMA